MFKLFRFLKPYWWQVIILLLATVLQVYTTLRLPALMADIINNGIVEGNTDYIWQTGLRMIGLAVISAAGSLISSYFSARIGSGYARDIRAEVFTKIIMPLSVPGVISGITMVFVPALTTFVISDILGGSKILLIGNVIEQEFTQSYNWHAGSGLSLVLMIFIVISMALISKYDKDGEGTTF